MEDLRGRTRVQEDGARRCTAGTMIVVRVAGILMLAIVAAGQSAEAVEKVGADRGQTGPRHQRAAEPPKHADDVVISAPGLEKAVEGLVTAVESANSKDKAQDDRAREQADLQAQQDMAKYARGALMATWVGILTSLCGLGLVWGTLRATKQAADASERAANIAATAFKVASRPFLYPHVENTNFDGYSMWSTFEDGATPGDARSITPPSIELTFPNHGQGAAELVRIETVLELSLVPPSPDGMRPALLHRERIVAPGEKGPTFTVKGGQRLPIGSLDANGKPGGRSPRLWLAGKVTYRGITPDVGVFETQFLWTAGDDPRSFAPCDEALAPGWNRHS